MNKKTIIIPVIALIIGLAVGWYFHQGPKFVSQATAPVGTTNSTPRMAQIVLDTTNVTSGAYDATANRYVYTSSTTPLCNTDANDRVIQTIDYVFPVLATVSTSTANQTLQIATSTSNTQIGSNTNYILNTNIVTTTPFLFTSSSTPGLTSTNAFRIWPAGICLTVQSTATSSSGLILKIPYIAE